MPYIPGTEFDDNLSGTDGADQVDGFAGNDIIDLRQGGLDEVYGGDGDDRILLGSTFTSDDIVQGGEGTDTVELAGDYSAGLTFGSQTMYSIDFLKLEAGYDYKFSFPQNANLGNPLVVDGSALGAADELKVDAAIPFYDEVVVVKGGAGADSFTTADGHHQFHAGAGIDTLIIDYSAAGRPIFSVNPANWSSQGGFEDFGGRQIIFNNIERLLLTTGNYNDRIVATAGDDRIVLNGGDDMLDAVSGSDIADGGDGDDGVTVNWSGLATPVSWNLQTGAFSGPGSFKNFEYFSGLTTGSGADNIVTAANGGYDRISTNGGNDRIVVVNGDDGVNAGAGTDTLVVDYGNAAGPVTSAPLEADGSGHTGGISADSERKVFFSGIDRLDVRTGAAADRIYTGNGDDRVTLNGGNDFVDVGAGVDSADGGAGADAIAKNLAAVTTAIVWNLATNSYSGPGSFTNFESFAKLVTGSGADKITTGKAALDDVVFTSAGNDSITVYNGKDKIDGGDGSDTLTVDYSSSTLAIETSTSTLSPGFTDGAGRSVTIAAVERLVVLAGSGNDSIVAGAGNDRIVGAGGNDGLSGMAGDDLLEGGIGVDTLSGGAGNDRLDGGTGGDTMYGGIGNDIYVVDNGADVTSEGGGGGTDLVESSVSYTLADGIEKLTLVGAVATRGTGNALANVIVGNSAANTLDGGQGADTLAGGAGDDIYVLDNRSDRVVEAASAGADTIRAATSFVLPANVENLILTGSPSTGTGNALDNRITGNAGANVLNGAAGSDVLLGYEGKDLLDGGTGADTMLGGDDDDSYVVDNAADKVAEASAGDGVDTVRSSVSFTLGNYVENLILTGTAAINGTGNALANSLTGNAVANSLTGNGGNDVIDGGAGGDTMAGGYGSDSYVVDNAADQVIELSNAGTDTVRSSVSHTLADHVEKLVLTGASALSGTGNGLANTIIGNAGGNALAGGGGNDVIDGGLGNDRLSGGTGADELKGGSGADHFLFEAPLGSANVDKILDFNATSDSILLDRAIFAAAGANGTLASSAFHKGTAAADALDRIVYDQPAGKIYYDADGSGGGAAVLFATVTPGISLSYADFIVYG